MLSAQTRVAAELLALTYGALVRQLLVDSEDCVDDVNQHLEKLCAQSKADCRLD